MWSTVSSSASVLARNFTAASLSAPTSLRAISTTSSLLSTPQPRRRSSRQQPEPQPGDVEPDLVGPPDPVSNLRPIYLAPKLPRKSPAADASSGTSTQAHDNASLHPYSLSEFTRPSSVSSSSSFRSSSSSSSPLRAALESYHATLLTSLEEAELKHRLSRASTELINQRFWSDNNRRYEGALDEYRSSYAQSTPPASTETKPTDGKQPPAKGADDDHLSNFYKAWLNANAPRHRNYNRWLWARTFSDLRPAFHFARLRWSEGVVRRLLGK